MDTRNTKLLPPRFYPDGYSLPSVEEMVNQSFKSTLKNPLEL